MAVKRITRRWLLNSFGVIVVIVVGIVVAFAFGISNYYYSLVRQSLETRANLAVSAFSQYSLDSVNFTGQVRDYVAAFADKGKMELMTIDAEGQIAITSSGFEPNSGELPDYRLALASQNRSGEWIGDVGGRRVMALCFLTPFTEPSMSAVRLVVSLTEVDRQVWVLFIAVVALGTGVLVLVLFSSSYFISSIVNPVTQVGETARKIAQGDFGARLKKRNNDEIGELCDIINYMAEELGAAEKIKNDFISSVSHELRTPLTAIQGWSETLLDDGGDDKQMLGRGIKVILNETTRLSQMVEELLDFSRMQSGRLKLIRSKMDVVAELSEAVLMYTERARREGIALLFADDEQLAIVYGDKNKLRQVFVNVLDNAIKYSNSGGTVTVQVYITPDVFPVTVADTGIGIREEDIGQVKNKFYKADSTRRGSGIGLAVADEIVTRHDGTLELSSVYGEGSTVTITLPIYKGQDEIALIENGD